MSSDARQLVSDFPQHTRSSVPGCFDHVSMVFENHFMIVKIGHTHVFSVGTTVLHFVKIGVHAVGKIISHRYIILKMLSCVNLRVFKYKGQIV